jgi:hypothetical protein
MSPPDAVERVAGSDGKTYPASYVAHRDAIRAEIEADPSATNTAIAKRMRSSRDTVIDVRKRMNESSGALEVTQENLPAIADARLPATYESAVIAITKASQIDECQQWSDRAMALASYARQSRDDRPHKMAIRIQARATRRCGELLKQVPPATGAHLSKKGDTPPLSRKQAATDAGLSDDQRKTALRVASVPKDDFELQVESTTPPTVTKLAEQGKKSRPLVDLGGIDPADYAAATQAQGALNRFAEFCRTHDPVQMAHAFQPHERQPLRDAVAEVDVWLDRFIVALPE